MTTTSSNGGNSSPTDHQGTPRRGRDLDGNDRLRNALISARIGVWEWDRRTDRLTWDGALESLFGIEPGTAPTTMVEFDALLAADEREHVRSVVGAALEHGDDFTVQYRVGLPDGTDRWLLGHGSPIWDRDEVVGLIGVCRDVTIRRQAQVENERLLREEAAARAEADAARSRLEFLLEATARMTEHLGLTERLDVLCRLGVPRFADGSAVHLLDDRGEPMLVSMHHRDEGRAEVLRMLLEQYPVRLDGESGIGAAIRTGRSGLLPEVTDEMLRQAAVSDHQLDMLRSLELTAGVVVPLVDPDGPFGAVTFFTTQGRRMTPTDLELAEQMCARVAVLVRNGQLIQARELDRKAYRYQAALLRSMFEASIDGILAVGAEGEVLAYNQRFLHLWGFDESLVGQGDAALLAEAERRVVDGENFVAGVTGAYRERPARVHDQVELANGRILDRNGTCLLDSEDNYLGFLWSFRDITLERAQAGAIAEAAERAATLSRTLQQSLLPPRLPKPPSFDLSARYHAAFEGLEVGGDFYDVFAVDDAWILVIGDVCGKGAEAATLTALARYTVRASAIHDSEPVNILRELNAAMVADAAAIDGFKRFATVCCIRICPDGESTVADIACGGHPPPLIRRADGTTESGGTPGTLLGIFPEVNLTNMQYTLRAGDSIIAFTDGVLEARSPDGDMLEVSGLTDAIASLVDPDASRLCQAIESRALEIQGGVAHDDIAILIARFDPDLRQG